MGRRLCVRLRLEVDSLKRSVWKAAVKYVVLFLAGGLLYGSIEILWRGYTHPSMIVVGGIGFLLVGGINDWFPRQISIVTQGVIGGTVITGLELLSGLFLNVYLHLGVWDYSNLPLNVMGQICLPFWGLWCLLSVAAIVVDDYLRYWLFEEEKPHYRIVPERGGK